MYTATLGKSEQLRAMNDDFGILPYPKYDENQKQYHSTSLDEFSLFVLPIDVKDKEMSAIITEALCAESSFRFSMIRHSRQKRRATTRPVR